MALINYKNRDKTDFILIHCTGSDDDIGSREIRRNHLAKGWLDIGYHFVIRLSGAVELGRQQAAPAGFQPQNSVAICLVGSEQITPEQAASLRSLVMALMDEYPEATILNKSQFTNLGEPNGTDIVHRPALSQSQASPSGSETSD